MYKILIIIVLFFLFLNNLPVLAYTCNRGHTNCHYSHSSGRSSHVYLIKKEQTTEENHFKDCKEHFLRTETTINYYSDGTRRVYKYHTVLNADGSVLISDCSDIKHLIQDKKHYILYKKSKKYKIIDGDGELITRRNYTSMETIKNNKLLVKYENKYGVIDLQENTIVPLKYKSIKQHGIDIFITELNGYYGILDSSNNIIIKNEYDKIKPLYDTFWLKKEGKYGLADFNGKIILTPEYDKIKKLGEYILVKKDDKYGVFDNYGKQLSAVKYKKIRLNRNILEGKYYNGTWKSIEML